MTYTPAVRQCPNCGSQFGCGPKDGQNCWCDDYPPIMDSDARSACKCPDCLHTAVKEKVDAFMSEVTPERANKPNAANQLPATPSVRDIDYYEENGLVVMTGWYLLRRGYCCKSGCRHCPYGYEPSF